MTKSATPKKNPAKKRAAPTNHRKLNVRQQRFCELVASGKSQAEAYLMAGWKVSQENARFCAARLATNDHIKARIAELRAPQTEEILRTKADNLRYLAEVIGTPIDQIGPDSPLCVEYTEDVVAGDAGGKRKRGSAPSGKESESPPIIRRRVKKPDTLRAIELYSKLLGHFEPDRIEVDPGPNTLATIQERARRIASALTLAPLRRN